MYIKICVLVHIILIVYVSKSRQAQVTWLDNQKIRPFFRLIKLTLTDMIGKTASTKQQLEVARRAKKLQDIIPDNIPFPCNVRGMRSKTRPTSVHKLRPGDIDVIAGMGDSLTAGNGIAATNIMHIYIENRGLSWSIGGQSTWREFVTLPNILKEFNPKIIGYSYSDGPSTLKSSQFNVGEPMAMSRDMPFMARELYRRIKNDARVDFKNDWKLITLTIGSNDICTDICYTKNMETFLENHRRDLIETFRYIRDNIPRTFVNLVTSPNLRVLVRDVTTRGQCKLTHAVECPCLFGLAHQIRLNKYLDAVVRWQEIEEDIGRMSEFIDLDTFTVVTQPFTKNIIFPKLSNNESDNSYLSTDCFHLSQKSDAKAANGLWNNMLEPIGNKSTTWPKNIIDEFRCPTIDMPYLYTSKNSVKNLN